MSVEKLITKNINILRILLLQNRAFEDLASLTRRKEGELADSLEILSKQNLINQHNREYSINNKEKVSSLLNILEPWVLFKNISHYKIAKEVAKIIHTKSWEYNNISDVILFGSTLDSPISNDIDLLLIHDSSKLEKYSTYFKKDRKLNSIEIFQQLGYKSDLTYHDSVSNNIYKKMIELFEDKNEYRDLENYLNEKDLNKLFDINILAKETLVDKDSNEQRKAAIESCEDPTFWYTVLSTGKIYDYTKHDFKIKVDDKYPNALELFSVN